MDYAKGMAEEKPKYEAVLQSTYGRLEKACAHYHELVSQIEEKMHGILNLRSQEVVDDKKGKEADMKDFVSSLNARIGGVEYLNGRLQGVYNHLQQII